MCDLFQVSLQRLGGNYGECINIDTENYTRNVYEEVYDDIIDYTMMVQCTSLN